jgi:hypothetical protein
MAQSSSVGHSADYRYLCTALYVIEKACILSLESIRLIVTELCYWQALGDADAENNVDDKM